MKTTIPKAPSHLSAETKKWWRDIVTEYALESQHLRILQLAAEAWDRCVQAREIIDKEGMTFKDRFEQIKARPEIAIERDSRISFARLVRELGLEDGGEISEGPRPPRIGGGS